MVATVENTEIFNRSLQAFGYARTNYLCSKRLDTYEGNKFRNKAVDFVDSYLYASQMSTIMVVLNLLYVDSEEALQSGEETISFDWMFKHLDLPLDKVDEWKLLLDQINPSTKQKAKWWRNKYFAHMDMKIFTITNKEKTELISYPEFDPIIKIIETIFDGIHTCLFGETTGKFDDTYIDFEEILKLK